MSNEIKKLVDHYQSLMDDAKPVQRYSVYGVEIDWFVLTLIFVTLEVLFDMYINLRQSRKLTISTLPVSLQNHNITTQAQFEKSQIYGLDKLKFGSFKKVVMYIFTIVTNIYFLYPYLWYESLMFSKRYFESASETVVSVVFFNMLFVLMTVIDLPFSIYNTFVLEQKHGFNNTTVPIYIKDKLKVFVLAFVIGSPVIGVLVYIIKASGHLLWLYSWLFLLSVSLIMMTIYPTFIAPLFNKYSPIEGELKDAVFELAKRVGFPCTNLFVCDNSRHSSHMNAYFFGFFKNKRIVLYDTLVKELDKEEILAVLCHEFGHYKKSHTLRLMVVQQIYLLVFFYLFGLFLNDVQLYRDFGYDRPHVLIGLLLFSGIYTPVDRLFSFVINIFTRKYEYEADKFAFDIDYDLSSSLIKLHVKENSSLIVDSWYSTTHYTHPTLLERLNYIKYLKSIKSKKE